MEILERRYPVLLRKFAIRRGSGGAGQFRGGNGVVREVQFLEPLHFGILSERRAVGLRCWSSFAFAMGMAPGIRIPWSLFEEKIASLGVVKLACIGVM